MLKQALNQNHHESTSFSVMMKQRLATEADDEVLNTNPDYPDMSHNASFRPGVMQNNSSLLFPTPSNPTQTFDSVNHRSASHKLEESRFSQSSSIVASQRNAQTIQEGHSSKFASEQPSNPTSKRTVFSMRKLSDLRVQKHENV